jgi:hypothetical protein
MKAEEICDGVKHKAGMSESQNPKMYRGKLGPGSISLETFFLFLIAAPRDYHGGRIQALRVTHLIFCECSIGKRSCW